MIARAAWAGVIVSELGAAVAWYAGATGARVVEQGDRWASLAFRDGSCLEVHEGDPARPGLTFPSYGSDPGPAVMPGYAVEDVGAAAAGLVVARSFPGWLVVLAPGGLRVVLAERDSEADQGLIGFAYTTPEPEELRAFLVRIGADGDVERGERTAVVPVLAGPDDADVRDPDGNSLRIVRAGR